MANIKGMSEEVQSLIKLWARQDNINSKDAADLLLLAELTHQEPDFVRLRWKNLRLQAGQVLYGITTPPTPPSIEGGK